MSADTMKAMGWLAMYALVFALAPLTPSPTEPLAVEPASVEARAQPDRLEKGDL